MESKLELTAYFYFLFFDAVDQCTSIRAQPKATTSTCHTRVSLEVHFTQEQHKPSTVDSFTFVTDCKES